MVAVAIKVIGAIVALTVLLFVLPKLFSREARMRRKLHAARQLAIRDLRDATPVTRRIAGMVVAVGEPLIAPLSGRPCVFYETRVVRAVGWGIDPWDIEYEVAIDRRSQPFLIDDGSGTAIIDPTRAEMLLGTDVDRWSYDDDADPAAENAFLARFRQRRRGLLFEKRLHFTESIVEVGERIAVAGTATHEQGPSAAHGDPYRHYVDKAQPRMCADRGAPLVVTDDPVFAPPLPEGARSDDADPAAGTR